MTMNHEHHLVLRKTENEQICSASHVASKPSIKRSNCILYRMRYSIKGDTLGFTIVHAIWDQIFDPESQKLPPKWQPGIANLRLDLRLNLKKFWLRRRYSMLYWRLHCNLRTKIGGHWRLPGSRILGRPAAGGGKIFGRPPAGQALFPSGPAVDDAR